MSARDGQLRRIAVRIRKVGKAGHKGAAPDGTVRDQPCGSSGLKSSATPLMQYLSPVGSGPSGNT